MDLNSWKKKVTSFWGDTIKFCVFLGNPYCSDDAFGYHVYIELNTRKEKLETNYRIFYSYSVDVESIITALMEEERPKTILIIDTINRNTDGERIKFQRMPFENMPSSIHKAEFSILTQIGKRNNIDLALLLVSIDEIQFTGEMQPLTPKIESIKNEIVNLFLFK